MLWKDLGCPLSLGLPASRGGRCSARWEDEKFGAHGMRMGTAGPGRGPFSIRCGISPAAPSPVNFFFKEWFKLKNAPPRCESATAQNSRWCLSTAKQQTRLTKRRRAGTPRRYVSASGARSAAFSVEGEEEKHPKAGKCYELV